MSKTNKSKSSLANVIKERAQRPDFLPKSFIEDNTRLAEETPSRAHAPALSSDRAPQRPDAQSAPTATSQHSASEGSTPPGTHAPAHPRSYAQAVLNAQGDEVQDFMPPPKSQPSASLAAPSLSPYRRALKRAATYLAEPAKDQLRVLCFNERTSEEDLLREAIDMLFKQRGLPAIAFQGAPSRQQRPH